VAIIPAPQVPDNIFAALLVWNSKLPFGKWQVEGSDDHDKLFFALDYCALSEGVNKGTFKVICEQMLKEVAEFDQRMKKAGVL